MDTKDFILGDIVAFKSKREGNDGWFTGVIDNLVADNIRISLFIPVEPQWYEDGDFTIAYKDDILQIVLLERNQK